VVPPQPRRARTSIPTRYVPGTGMEAVASQAGAQLDGGARGFETVHLDRSIGVRPAGTEGSKPPGSRADLRSVRFAPDVSIAESFPGAEAPGQAAGAALHGEIELREQLARIECSLSSEAEHRMRLQDVFAAELAAQQAAHSRDVAMLMDTVHGMVAETDRDVALLLEQVVQRLPPNNEQYASVVTEQRGEPTESMTTQILHECPTGGICASRGSTSTRREGNGSPLTSSCRTAGEAEAYQAESFPAANQSMQEISRIADESEDATQEHSSGMYHASTTSLPDTECLKDMLNQQLRRSVQTEQGKKLQSLAEQIMSEDNLIDKPPSANPAERPLELGHATDLLATTKDWELDYQLEQQAAGKTAEVDSQDQGNAVTDLVSSTTPSSQWIHYSRSDSNATKQDESAINPDASLSGCKSGELDSSGAQVPQRAVPASTPASCSGDKWMPVPRGRPSVLGSQCRQGGG